MNTFDDDKDDAAEVLTEHKSHARVLVAPTAKNCTHPFSKDVPSF